MDDFPKMSRQSGGKPLLLFWWLSNCCLFLGDIFINPDTCMFTSCVCDIQGYVYIYIQRERENKMYSCRSTSACARTFQTSQSLLNAAFNHFWLYVPITFESLSFSKSLLKHFKITFGYISRITCKSRLNQEKNATFQILAVPEALFYVCFTTQMSLKIWSFDGFF